MYKISDRQYALEEGDNISFVRDGGGKVQLFAGECEAMSSPNPDDGPDLYAEQEMVILEVRNQTIPSQMKMNKA
jgi:hypothetical protein